MLKWCIFRRKDRLQSRDPGALARGRERVGTPRPLGVEVKCVPELNGHPSFFLDHFSSFDPFEASDSVLERLGDILSESFGFLKKYPF